MPGWSAPGLRRRHWPKRGFVRVNGTRIDAAGRMLRAGDVITVALDRRVRVLKVKGFAERRGPSGSTAALYEDLEMAGSGPSALRAPDPMR